MSENKNMLVELNKSVNGDATFEDDSKVLVKGKINILFRAKNDNY